MITEGQIAAAKAGFHYSHPADVLHEHDDCIRMAYAWLDAQTTIATINRKFRPLKHIIEKWAGRYVSQSDVEVAAAMHPRIRGTYPFFNLSSRLVLPSDRRLKGIGEALTQNYRERLNPESYATREVEQQGHPS